MAFIDNLAYSLFMLSFAGFILLYTISSVYMAYRKNKKDFGVYLRSAGVPLGLIGAYMLIVGLWGQFTWPLPGSYNILFYDPFISFGILLMGFALSVRYNVRLEYVGFLGLLVGVMVIIYGIEGYGIGLTSAPMALLGLYFLYGVTGILSYPVALVVERLPGLKKNPWIGWYILIALFWIVLLFASLLAGYIGSAAISSHLISPP
ncbi:MAG: DUF981 family protein [Candidatus Marsarchaeota archaeon]|jgi:putative membrane protein|nr:DUF981 family protein [Candidatus Marsarchaeota archaeon]